MRLILCLAACVALTSVMGCAAPFDVASTAERDGVAPLISRAFVIQLHRELYHLDQTCRQTLSSASGLVELAAREREAVPDMATLNFEIARLEDARRDVAMLRDRCDSVAGMATLTVIAYDDAIAKLDRAMRRNLLTGWPEYDTEWQMYSRRMLNARREYARRADDTVAALPKLHDALELLDRALAILRRAREIH